MLWLGYRNDGLSKFDIATETFTHCRPDPNDPHSFPKRAVVSLYRAADGMIWVGTEDGDLARLEPQTGVITVYRHDPENPASEPPGTVHITYQD